MKVMQLCLSDGVGGLELYVLRTAKQFAAKHIDCVAAVRHGTMLAKRMQDEGVRCLSINRSKVAPFFTAKHLAGFIDREKVDVLHMHWGKDLLLAVLAKKMAKKPVKLVYTRQMMITRSKQDWYHKWLYREVDLFLTITDQLADLAKQFLPLASNEIKRLYYGVDEPQAAAPQDRAALRQSLGVSGDTFAVGLVGRIEEGKGQHLLIQAISDLAKQNVPACAVIIGPKMNEAYFERLQQQVKHLHVEQNIVFYGAHKNPTEIMPAFDAVVLATKQETFGLVLIEAMRSGVAVVGTNAGGVPEIIDHELTGLLIQPESAQDLSEKLLWLYKNPQLRQRMALAGKEKADRLFSTETHYDQLVKHFEELVSQ
ncbi:glycosyltransferase family 4 protein [Kaarinaea lacus]